MTTQPSWKQERRIVVGVDGSVSSKGALAWAVRQAHLAGAVVEAVTAWQLPAAYGHPVPLVLAGAVAARREHVALART